MMGVINTSGDIVVPLKFSFCKALSDTIFKTTMGSVINWGPPDIVDSRLRIDTTFAHGLIHSIVDNMGERYEPCVAGGKYGLFSIGKEIVPPIYEWIRANKDCSLFFVKKNEKWGIIDKQGQLLVECMYDSLDLI